MNKQIACELGISEASIKAHLAKVFTKLKVESRTQVVLAVQMLAHSEATAAHGRFH